MQMNDVISTLNELIQTCKDGEQGFTTAADGVSDPDLKRLFMTYAEQRGRFASELQAEVARLGGDPERKGSVVASLHRGWMNLKAAVTGNDDEAVIAAAETGEDVAKESYDKALRESLPADVREIVQRQYSGIREAHDRVRFLKRAA
jgi:uncharacterized protein (TIGR02284 family)